MLQIKSDTSNFELDFNGTGKEEEAFLDAVSLAISMKKENVATTKEFEIKEVANKPIINETETELTAPVVVEDRPSMPVVKKQEDTESNYSKPVQNGTATNRKLVIGLCDACEDQYGVFIYDGVEGTYKVKCRKCDNTNYVIIDDLVPARMQCECGKVNNFYMEASQYATIECKNCKADVDMIYHDKHKKMVSANLL